MKFQTINENLDKISSDIDSGKFNKDITTNLLLDQGKEIKEYVGYGGEKRFLTIKYNMLLKKLSITLLILISIVLYFW